MPADSPSTERFDAPIDRYRLAAGYGRALAAHTAEMGVEIAPLAEAVGLNAAEFERLGHTVSLDRFARLLEALAALTGDPAFGYGYGERFPLGGTGPIGYGMRAAPDGFAALSLLVKYVRVNVDLALSSLEIDGAEVRLSWAFSPMLVRVEQFSDLSAILVVRHLRDINGPGWLPQLARLERRDGGAGQRLRAGLARRIEFGCELNQLVFDLADLRRPNPSADPILLQLMTERCEAAAAARAEPLDLVGRVREEVLGLLGVAPVTADRVAVRLGMSVRSLQRHLGAAGVNFQDMVDDVRRGLSSRLLTQTELSLQEISHRLGFSAQSSYTRSALRWYGAAPSTLRKG